VLGSLKKDKEATAHFEKALAIDPKHVDAAYNAVRATTTRRTSVTPRAVGDRIEARAR